MRCKKHATDLSSIAGVCASCLRERLFRLILAQEQIQAQSLNQNHCNLNSDTNSTIPRSITPINRRNSVNSVNPVAITQRPYTKPRLNHSQSDKRFYNSPQITINTGGCIGSSSSKTKKLNLIRFPSISKLFRSDSRNGDTDSNCSESCGTGGGRPSSVTSSPSLFSNVLPRRKNKAFYVDDSSTIETTGVVRKPRCVSDRGMSLARSSDSGGEEEEFSDLSIENLTSESCKQTPMNQTFRRGGGGEKSVTELIFCPLVRASLNRNSNVKGKPAVDGGFSGDMRAPAVPHLAYAKSFCANRSRKLADFGRFDPNR